jgi:hypothetical protein
MIQTQPRIHMPRPKPTSRDRLAHLFMAAWVCIILQGALRKWVFPGVTVVYLVQDVPLIFAYVYAVWKGLIWRGKLEWVCILIGSLLTLETLIQILALAFPLKTAVIGLHQYIFYLPILFLAPMCFNHKHRRVFLRWNLLSIAPMSIIAALQSRSPKGAWINRTASGDDTAFSIAGSTAVRATGTFNFTLPFAIWCGFAVALVIGEWLTPPARRSFKSTTLIFVCTMCAILATMVSGSRSAVLLAAAAFFGGFVVVLMSRNRKNIMRFVAVLILLPALAGIAYLVAPDSFTGNLNRLSDEGNQEEMTSRIWNMSLGFVSGPDFSILGKGIGTGIQAGSVGSADAYRTQLSEWDTIRAVQELGTFPGVALVLIRYGSVLALLMVARRAQLQRASFPLAIPLAVSTIPTLAIGDVWRVAPQVATQVFFFVAIICGAFLFRREPVDSATQQPSVTR